MSKEALCCAVSYITSSGMDDALTECEIFGIKTLDAVLKGKHYVHAFHGMLIVSEVVESRIWKAFWNSTEKNEYGNILSDVKDLVEALKATHTADAAQHFQDVLDQGQKLQ